MVTIWKSLKCVQEEVDMHLKYYAAIRMIIQKALYQPVKQR